MDMILGIVSIVYFNLYINLTKMTTLSSLKTDMLQQLQLPSSLMMAVVTTETVFKLKSVVIFVKLIIHSLLLNSFGNLYIT